MKTLIVLSAPPGSGKSTYAKEYANTHPNTLIISSDEIRYELTGQYQDFSHQKEVWELFSRRIHEYGAKKDVTVILDALCDLNVLRIKYAKENPEFDKRILVIFNRDYLSISKFNKLRNKEHWVPDDQLKILYDKFEKLSDEAKACYNEVIYIDNYK